MSRPRRHREDEDESMDGGEPCPVCHQEFSHGVCPIRSADCPYLEEDEEEEEFEDDEDEQGDDEDEDSDDEN